MAITSSKIVTDQKADHVTSNASASPTSSVPYINRPPTQDYAASTLVVVQQKIVGGGKKDVEACSSDAAVVDSDVQGPEILSLPRFLPIFAGLTFAMFVISLDKTVVATAQVRISQELDGQRAIAWLPTTFLIGQASFTVFFGQTLAMFSSKSVWLVSILLFELGSLTSGVAPTMNVMLAGRTVSGVGAAGIFMSAMQILTETSTLAARAQYMGMLGALFSVSMVAGPLVGGALTDQVTWRWVFYINLPFGGAAWLLTMFLFPRRTPLGIDKRSKASLCSKLSHIDVIGTALFVGLVCMLVIPLQQAHLNGWTTARTLAPIAFSVPVMGLCALWFHYRGEQRSLMSLRLFRDLNFVGCATLSFLTFWSTITYTYFFPFFYQCVRGRSATQSGLDMLALMITLALCSLVTGVIAKRTGYCYPQMFVGPLFGVAGAAVLYFQRVDSSVGFQIGTQILVGIGTGSAMQMTMLTVQANIKDRALLAKATSFIVFVQMLGGGIGSSVSGAIVASQFPLQIRRYLPAGSDQTKFALLTPDQAFGLPPGAERDAILRALARVISYVYAGGLPVFATMWLLIVFTVRIKDLKTQKLTRKRHLVRRLFCLLPRSAADAEKQQTS